MLAALGRSPFLVRFEGGRERGKETDRRGSRTSYGSVDLLPKAPSKAKRAGRHGLAQTNPTLRALLVLAFQEQEVENREGQVFMLIHVHSCRRPTPYVLAFTARHGRSLPLSAHRHSFRSYAASPSDEPAKVKPDPTTLLVKTAVLVHPTPLERPRRREILGGAESQMSSVRRGRRIPVLLLHRRGDGCAAVGSGHATRNRAGGRGGRDGCAEGGAGVERCWARSRGRRGRSRRRRRRCCARRLEGSTFEVRSMHVSKQG